MGYRYGDQGLAGSRAASCRLRVPAYPKQGRRLEGASTRSTARRSTKPSSRKRSAPFPPIPRSSRCRRSRWEPVGFVGCDTLAEGPRRSSSGCGTRLKERVACSFDAATDDHLRQIVEAGDFSRPSSGSGRRGLAHLPRRLKQRERGGGGVVAGRGCRGEPEPCLAWPGRVPQGACALAPSDAAAGRPGAARPGGGTGHAAAARLPCHLPLAPAVSAAGGASFVCRWPGAWGSLPPTLSPGAEARAWS